MKTITKTLVILVATLLLCGLTGCRLSGGDKPSNELLDRLAQHKDKPPVSSMSGPITGEYVTAGGSKLTFLEDGAEDYWDSGFVIVEFAGDAEYLLEGRENTTVYRYVFGMNNLPAPYDVADDFQLSTGEEWFANCHSHYRICSDVSLKLTPYLLEGEELIFERMTVPGEGGTYDLVPGETGYFDFTKEE